VTVLDAFAVIALFKGEPAGGRAQALIEGGGCALTTLGLAEVVDHLVRLAGASEEEAVLDVAQLGLDDPIELDEGTAIHAALLRARHYDRKTCQVSLADCVAAGGAHARQTAVATSDPHLLDLCHNERINVIVLPDSRGALWTPEDEL
jgi:PIN domain nuclease of toxin-antitoxin system